MPILALVLTGSAAAAPIPWPVESGGTGHYYEQILTPLGWEAAQSFAEAASFAEVSGHLATIGSQQVWGFVRQNFDLTPQGGGGGSWLGGFQDVTAPDYQEPAGGWRWMTGEPWSFTAWGVNEPNNAGGMENFLEALPGHWNDERGSR